MKFLGIIDGLFVIVIAVLTCWNRNAFVFVGLIVYIFFSIYIYQKKYYKNVLYSNFRNLSVSFVFICLFCNNNLIKQGNVLLLSAVISVALFLCYFLLLGKNKKIIAIMFLCVMIFSGFYNLLIAASKTFAYNSIENGIAEVTNLNMPTRSLVDAYSTYSIQVQINAGEIKEKVDVYVNYKDYNAYNIGDKVEYTLYDGLWGEEYLVIKKPDSPS